MVLIKQKDVKSMSTRMNKKDLILEILRSEEDELELEEMMQLLIQKKVSSHPDEVGGELTFGMRASDKLAQFAGSWTFIIIFMLVIVFWIVLNIFFLLRSYDPYPFILLNLILSCIAAIQAPIIMMSQNRQEKKDRERATSDYFVNLKTELIIEDIYNKIDEVLKRVDTLGGEKND